MRRLAALCACVATRALRRRHPARELSARARIREALPEWARATAHELVDAAATRLRASSSWALLYVANCGLCLLPGT
jgi:hypothetical protein